MTAARDLSDALNDLAGIFGDPQTAEDVGSRFTCWEANLIADALRVAGHVTAAETWLRGHAEGDDEGDLHFAMNGSNVDEGDR